MHNAFAAYQAWKLADLEARALESKLTAMWEDVVSNSGAPPSSELLWEVARLRAVANEKLTASILALSSNPPDSG